MYDRNNLILILLLVFFAACGRRGDPVEIVPYGEVGVVKDLSALLTDGNLYLAWGIPEGKNFPEEAIKGFVVFRAEVPDGVRLEECKCSYRSLDFIAIKSRKPGRLRNVTGKAFEYLDNKTVKDRTYVYKVVVMDKNNRMGNDSNTVLVKGVKSEKPASHERKNH